MSTGLITHLETHIWVVPSTTYVSFWKKGQCAEVSRNMCAHTQNAWADTRLDTCTRGHIHSRTLLLPQIDSVALEQRGLEALLWTMASSESPSAGPRAIFLQVPSSTHTHALWDLPLGCDKIVWAQRQSAWPQNTTVGLRPPLRQTCPGSQGHREGSSPTGEDCRSRAPLDTFHFL